MICLLPLLAALSFAAPEPSAKLAGPVMPLEQWRALIEATVSQGVCTPESDDENIPLGPPPAGCVLILDPGEGHRGGSRASVVVDGDRSAGRFAAAKVFLYREYDGGVYLGLDARGRRVEVPRAARLRLDARTGELLEAKLETPRLCEEAAPCRGWRVERYLLEQGGLERRVQVAVDLIELNAQAAGPMLLGLLETWQAKAGATAPSYALPRVHLEHLWARGRVPVRAEVAGPWNRVSRPLYGSEPQLRQLHLSPASFDGGPSFSIGPGTVIDERGAHVMGISSPEIQHAPGEYIVSAACRLLAEPGAPKLLLCREDEDLNAQFVFFIPAR